VATGNDEDRRMAVQYGDQRVERGHGGETHQIATGSGPRLTTQQGTVVSDDQNTLRAGERGPSVLEDSHFREKIFHFDHERIPERVVHARGYGAHGYFENYEPLTDVTRADLFSEAGLRTPAFVRFSTVAGNKGSADLARDFVTDAYAHCKFIGYTDDAALLFEAAGLSRLMDDDFISLDETAAAEFISRCAELRFWSRQLSVAGARTR
jgi:hypothetical protein